MSVQGEPWIPIRYVHHDVICQLCWGRIPRGSPGNVKGERGTKAWILKAARMTGIKALGPDLFECIPCHDDCTTAELAAA